MGRGAARRRDAGLRVRAPARRPLALSHPVLINARAAVRAEIGGVERLAREMALRLPALNPERYGVLRPPAALAHRAGHAWEQAALPLLARGAELIYSPANLAPLLSSRNVVVLHDAAALRHPEAYSAGYAAYQRALLPRIARRARLIIAVSRFARDELVELLRAPAERIRVIPDGVDERFSPAADPAPVRRALGLQRDYVLALGTASARKNLSALEVPARALAERGVELVVAGSERGYLRGGSDGAGAIGIPRRLGYVQEALLPGLYAGARALVMPSLYEGFGLPCLEAMASGVPVVCSPFGALPETVGDAALLVDPGRPGELSDALLAVLEDAALRERLIAAGLERAARYSWQRVARETDGALGELLGSR